MSVNIERGLFGPDFIDYHAILGAPVDADPQDIRKYYLKLARRLHPDSCAKESEEDRTRAAEYLSKWVNPAYEKLSNAKELADYRILISLKGKQAKRQPETFSIRSATAKSLFSASSLEGVYKAALKELTGKQYDHLDQTAEITGEISELNLAFLMLKDGKIDIIEKASAHPNNASSPGTPPARPAPPPKKPPTTDELVDSAIRRAEESEKKQDYSAVILELRQALQINPRSAKVHSRLGMVYLKTNQPTMAKIHINKALELDPEDPLAKEGRDRLDPPDKSGSGGKRSSPKGSKAPPPKSGGTGKQNPKGKPGDPGGGFLGGLFGNKKK
jgi:curved DNA-binding protein CbpA